MKALPAICFGLIESFKKKSGKYLLMSPFVGQWLRFFLGLKKLNK